MSEKTGIFKSNFSHVILGVFLAITMKVAIDVGTGSFVKNETAPDMWQAFIKNPKEHLFGLFQLLAFLATLCRFYAGAHRLHAEPTPKATITTLVVNATWTIFLFICFYFAALVVDTRGVFLIAVMVFHGIDLCWFSVSLNQQQDWPPHIKRVISDYLLYDLLTLASGGVVLVWYWLSPFPTIYIQLASSVILVSMFVFDVLYKTRDWYFNPEKWKAEYVQ